MSSGLVNVGRMVGATLGVAVLGTVLGGHAGDKVGDAPRFLARTRLAFVIAGLVEVAGAAVALVGLRRDSLQAIGTAQDRRVPTIPGGRSAGLTCIRTCFVMNFIARPRPKTGSSRRWRFPAAGRSSSR